MYTFETKELEAFEEATAQLAAAKQERADFVNNILSGDQGPSKLSQIDERIAYLTLLEAQAKKEVKPQLEVDPVKLAKAITDINADPNLNTQPIIDASQALTAAITAGVEKLQQEIDKRNGHVTGWSKHLTDLHVPKEGAELDGEPITHDTQHVTIGDIDIRTIDSDVAKGITAHATITRTDKSRRYWDDLEETLRRVEYAGTTKEAQVTNTVNRYDQRNK